MKNRLMCYLLSLNTLLYGFFTPSTASAKPEENSKEKSKEKMSYSLTFSGGTQGIAQTFGITVEDFHSSKKPSFGDVKINMVDVSKITTPTSSIDGIVLSDDFLVKFSRDLYKLSKEDLEGMEWILYRNPFDFFKEKNSVDYGNISFGERNLYASLSGCNARLDGGFSLYEGMSPREKSIFNFLLKHYPLPELDKSIDPNTAEPMFSVWSDFPYRVSAGVFYSHVSEGFVSNINADVGVYVMKIDVKPYYGVREGTLCRQFPDVAKTYKLLNLISSVGLDLFLRAKKGEWTFSGEAYLRSFLERGKNAGGLILLLKKFAIPSRYGAELSVKKALNEEEQHRFLFELYLNAYIKELRGKLRPGLMVGVRASYPD